ncbi:P-loop ATPase, Sll1717 family [Roseococcus suduntuyensis]|uniref:Uncharacterized protein n=1 Tax=Roseococcus suduntuyensis TaxID=455361 RepID=A0A840AFT0_9PROT|nr:hypothetical protein [Roseococcus suduntuyensis]MBB3899907.1 hypothetical protein [Roseococcus suduntuyensis]
MNNIPIKKIYVGELDAKDELYMDERGGRTILLNSFVQPPGVDIEKFQVGEKFLIIGTKGSGKTAFLGYMKSKLDENYEKSALILFKSEIDEAARIGFTKSNHIFSITDQKNLAVEYDFRDSWRHLIFKQLIIRLSEVDAPGYGKHIEFLKRLFGVADPLPRMSFRDFGLKKIELSLRAAWAQVQASAEFFELVKSVDNTQPMSVDRILGIAERILEQIRFLPNFRYYVFLDELELFNEHEDQLSRDLALIRDLIVVADQFNRWSWRTQLPFLAYVSARTEVIEEVKKGRDEINKLVRACGQTISWGEIVDEEHHPLLTAIERKIQLSEVYERGEQSGDVLRRYFPESLFGESAAKYLLDISMFRPRNMVALLKAASGRAGSDDTMFGGHIFSRSQTIFSADIWNEVKDDLAVAYTPKQIEIIRAALSGWTEFFNANSFRQRIENLGFERSTPKLNRLIDPSDYQELLERLFRSGAIGQDYVVIAGSRRRRQRWSFRDHHEVVPDGRYMIHKSLRKILGY